MTKKREYHGRSEHSRGNKIQAHVKQGTRRKEGGEGKTRKTTTWAESRLRGSYGLYERKKKRKRESLPRRSRKKRRAIELPRVVRVQMEKKEEVLTSRPWLQKEEGSTTTRPRKIEPKCKGEREGLLARRKENSPGSGRAQGELPVDRRADVDERQGRLHREITEGILGGKGKEKLGDCMQYPCREFKSLGGTGLRGKTKEKGSTEACQTQSAEGKKWAHERGKKNQVYLRGK